MARCQVCNRKLVDPSATHCGKGKSASKCVARPEEVIPRCMLCGNLMIAGRGLCPATKGACISIDPETKEARYHVSETTGGWRV